MGRLKKVVYRDYITSDTWRKKHPGWLKQANYRCSMFPWVRVGKGHPYNCHHTNYKNLGKEVYQRDIIVLSPLAHKWVVHGVLSNFKRPSQQDIYPNTLQVMAHGWCRLPSPIKCMAPVLGAYFICRSLIWLMT